MKKTILTLVFLTGTLLSSEAFADEYMIDPVHSSVEFSVRHMVIANVKGDFTDFAGTIIYNDSDITRSSVEVGIKTASISTNNAGRDEHLRSADFFYAEKFPEITFESSKVEKGDDGHILHGTLTMNGVSHEISIPFEFLGKVLGPDGKKRLGFAGHTELNRKDYGITWNKTLDTGGLAVGDEVKIELNIEAVQM